MHVRVEDHEVFTVMLGSGRPILFLHGGSGFDHTYFRPWLDSLGEQAQLIYYDQFGQGRSTRPASYEDITMAGWADEADALRSALGFERITLFGHSFGGFIAQEYALRHGDHLDGLILSNTSPALDYPEIMIANAQQRATPEQFQTLMAGLSTPAPDDQTLKETFSTILPIYFAHYDPAIGASLGEAVHYSAGAFNQGMGKLVQTFSTLDRLAEITVPTLVIGGRHDWITPPAQGAERLAAGLSNAQMH
ncbi:MAG TPA: alpha/beta fold hydrolase, partial [Ktedonobacteraceae bacterium]|nr:alpha/beta fold hydrolase [Ktedonobacteraceae bacterium]